ncbi:MAG TPA: hypothetical protein VL171_10475 [Verrucomicrobiae bacterium]|nr:hypothetical protein [Verrucomicrobiae bacterium]
MKVTIQHASEPVAGETQHRRTLGVLTFAPRNGEGIPTLVLPDTPIPVAEENSLVLHASVVPQTRRLSVMIGQHLRGVVTHVFTAGSVWDGATYFAFRLPTGQFIELYFEHEEV